MTLVALVALPAAKPAATEAMVPPERPGAPVVERGAAGEDAPPAGAGGGAGAAGHGGAAGAGSAGTGEASGGHAGGGAAGNHGAAGTIGSAGGMAGAAGASGHAGSAGAAGSAGGTGGAAGKDGGGGGAAGGGGGTAGGPAGGAGGHAAADAGTRLCTVKINELQTGGATALDEFVELYNTCPDQAFDLTGYALVYRSAAGTTDLVRVSFAGGGFTAGKPYFVCANTGYSGQADVRYSDGLAEAGGGLAIRDPDGKVVDAVGWGTATNAFVEGSPATAPSAGQSIARIPDGHDTNDNATDFTIIGSPTTPGGPN